MIDLAVMIEAALICAAVVGFFPWKSKKKKKNWKEKKSIQCKMERDTKRYVSLSSVNKLTCVIIPSDAYKFSAFALENLIPTVINSLSKIFATIIQIVFVVWKETTAMASSVQPGKVKEKGKAPITVDLTHECNAHNPTNLPNLPTIPILKLPGGGLASKTRSRKGGCAAPKFDPTAMFNKLAAARENSKKKKELTLVGILVGGQKEFPRIFAKLRMKWKPLKGTLSFNPLKSGWFEISFSNQLDFQMIWNNRPYHLFSQLLLIKQWYPGFDPTNESISTLDLWVRLHYLPEEFANKDALETIIEGNFVGKFIRMDPSHNNDRWNLFPRFCINTDVERTLGKGVIVPDEHFNQIKYSLWFDDFSPGCGACGKSAHTFRDCPSKNSPIPTLQLTIKKPSSKKPHQDYPLSSASVREGWNLMGKNNKPTNPLKLVIPNNNVYLTEKGGISVTFESDDSEDSVQHLLETEEITLGGPNLLSVAADLHPYNIIREEKSDLDIQKNQGVLAEEQLLVDPTSEGRQISGNLNIKEQIMDKDNKCLDSPFPSVLSSRRGNLLINSDPKNCIEALDRVERDKEKDSSVTKENLLQPKLGSVDSHINKIQCDPEEQKINPHLPPAEGCYDTQQQHPFEEEMIEYEEEQDDYEYEDLLLEEPTDRARLNTTRTLLRNGYPIMISEDPPFSEKDLEEFINNDLTSEGTFLSFHNSMNSSSFINGMERLIVQPPVHSNTTSSKRRVKEGTEDTATSEIRAGKKPRT